MFWKFLSSPYNISRFSDYKHDSSIRQNMNSNLEQLCWVPKSPYKGLLVRLVRQGVLWDTKRIPNLPEKSHTQIKIWFKFHYKWGFRTANTSAGRLDNYKSINLVTILYNSTSIIRVVRVDVLPAVQRAAPILPESLAAADSLLYTISTGWWRTRHALFVRPRFLKPAPYRYPLAQILHWSFP